jgi:hypothetical protein
MLTLDTTADTLLLVLIAAAGGMVGGLAAELLLSRDGQTGAFELPGRRTGLLDLGGFASLIVGAVAGVAILLVLPATTTVVTTDADGTTTTAASVDLLRLIATTLVAGSAGGSVLTALQSRVTAAINEARVEFVRATGEEEVDRVRDTAVRQLDAMARSVGTAAAGGARAPAGARSRSIGGAVATPAISEADVAAAAREIQAVAGAGRRAVSNAARSTPRDTAGGAAKPSG